MAQKTRQTKLFAAEDYTIVYDSFINANLQAYDYDTIRTAMVEYVRNNYPENYNDWIESAEFVALLDVVAQFGHNLAFRIDLNSRNNFLSTAERQESVYKLAEFLGYQPMRNVPAFGDIKITSVKTNEAVIGSEGTSIGGQEIRFENTTDVNNMDNFITAINAVMQTSNQFGSPVKQLIIENITHQFYKLNNTENQYTFSVVGSAAGKSSTFEIVGLDLDNATKHIIETAPDKTNALSIIYKNDGLGITSSDTGFFLGIKQGSLQFRDFTINDPIDNMSFDIDVNNINSTDVWVSTIDGNGNATAYWTKVENTYSQNNIYNTLAGSERNIFSVKTRENDQITVCFSDKNFGNLPKGKIRIWFRTSINATYRLRSDDVGSQKINIDYIGADGNSYTATVGLQIKKPIISATSRQSLDSIKEAAPKNYSAQNRMITASDYNNVVQTFSEDALKTKSINRTHSGHSRYLHTMDPTGAYTSVNVFNKDGKIFAYDSLRTISTVGETPNHAYNKYVKNILNNVELLNLYYTKFNTAINNLKPTGYPNFDTVPNTLSGAIQWQTPTDNAIGSNNGYFVTLPSASIIKTGKTQTSYTQHIEVGTLLEFAVPTIDNGIITEFTTKWAKVVNIYNNGLGIFDSTGDPTGLTSTGKGSIVLDAEIPDNAYIKTIYPAFNRVFNDRERQIITGYIEAKKSFAIRYNLFNTSWEIFEPNTTQDYNDPQPTDFNNSNNEQSWLLWFEYANDNFNIYTRTFRIEFNSEAVEFSNINNEYNLSTYTLKSQKDKIVVLNDNFVPAGEFFVSGYFTDENGVANSNRIIVSLEDSNNDVRPNNPRSYDDVVGTSTISYDYDDDGTATIQSGKENLRFEWEHNPADNILVDPSFTNVIDVFVLSREYDRQFRQYLLGNTAQPSSPTSYQLSKMFSDISNKKAMSDSIVYRGVTYKPLFGLKAQPQLRARFRIIKVKNSNMTDNDVKSKVIETIGKYFEVANWDFGETFYFTELAAYVHQQLSGIISSFVIVPQGNDSVFGDLFEIKPSSSEMFIPDVKVEDVDIIDTITDANIRAGQ
jgi:hypothetical protein